MFRCNDNPFMAKDLKAEYMVWKTIQDILQLYLQKITKKRTTKILKMLLLKIHRKKLK